MEIQKFYHPEDGRVAVLYSPGFGAGWSSWADDQEQETVLLFDANLVSMAMNKAQETEVRKYLSQVFPDRLPYTGGWKNISIEWMAPRTFFRVREYDGSESFEYYHTMEWRVA